MQRQGLESRAAPRRDMAEATVAPPAIFVLGAGRSGTTLLYKLLCMHPALGWISNHLVRAPWLPEITASHRLFRLSPESWHGMWFSPDGNAYLRARRLIRRIAPTPTEGERVYTRCGIPTFPSPDWRIDDGQVQGLHSTFRRLLRAQGASALVSKRTANNRRIGQLFEAFPQAKFVHIVRDGRAVAASLLRVPWWPDHGLWWRDLKTPAQLVAAGERELEIAARNWVEELTVIERGIARLPADQVTEFSYESLAADRRGALSRVAAFLGLPDVDAWLDAVERLPVRDRNDQWATQLDPEQQACVHRIQAAKLAQYGYLIEAATPGGS
jgi:omega-hydroxy-beta-dihydromenaquinone-9 sulfotransferase